MKMQAPTILRYASILYRYSQIYLAGRLKPLRIGVGLYPFMLAICRQPGLNQESLSETLVMDKGTTAKAVKELEDKGCIVRKPDQSDGRINRLYPTPCGDAMRTRIDGFLREWSDMLWRGFSDGERAQSYDLLQRMAANAQAHMVAARQDVVASPE